MSERDCTPDLDWGAPWQQRMRAELLATVSQRLDEFETELRRLRVEVEGLNHETHERHENGKRD